MPRQPRGGTLDPKTLAQRLNLLLDIEEANRGTSVQFAELEDYVDGAGSSLSRAKWTYMLAGNGRRNRDTHLLEALASFFHTESQFLLEDGPVPEQIKAQMSLVRALRAARVKGFAARTFQGDLSPNALERIAEVLQEESDVVNE